MEGIPHSIGEKQVKDVGPGQTDDLHFVVEDEESVKEAPDEVSSDSGEFLPHKAASHILRVVEQHLGWLSTRECVHQSVQANRINDKAQQNQHSSEQVELIPEIERTHHLTLELHKDIESKISHIILQKNNHQNPPLSIKIKPITHKLETSMPHSTNIKTPIQHLHDQEHKQNNSQIIQINKSRRRNKIKITRVPAILHKHPPIPLLLPLKLPLQYFTNITLQKPSSKPNTINNINTLYHKLHTLRIVTFMILIVL